MRKIKLTQGKTALVDNEDYEKIVKMGKWQAQKNHITNYAIRSVHLNEKTPAGWYKKKTIRMHHVIMPQKEGYVVDHINRNGLDNRKENLRYVSKSQNQANRAVNRNKRNSKYKGVVKYKNSGGIGAQISYNKESYFLGMYQTEEDAARAYNLKAIELFGDNALLNDVDMTKEPQKYQDQYKCNMIKIKCIETDEIFDSITEAAKKMNINRVGVTRVVNGLQKKCGGYSFIKI